MMYGTLERQRYFNSTLVRLKAENAAMRPPPPELFQFHTGTIKRNTSSFRLRASGIFQFHTGTIKRSGNARNVRGTVGFQFHTGTIKRLMERPFFNQFANFNSTLVRLKAGRMYDIEQGKFYFNSTLVRLKVQ